MTNYLTYSDTYYPLSHTDSCHEDLDKSLIWVGLSIENYLCVQNSFQSRARSELRLGEANGLGSHCRLTLIGTTCIRGVNKCLFHMTSVVRGM